MPESPLDHPQTSAHAWARYRRLMRQMALLSLVVVVLGLGYFYLLEGTAPVAFYVALALGIAGTIMLTSALMGLVFLSSGTGHDEAVADAREKDDR